MPSPSLPTRRTSSSSLRAVLGAFKLRIGVVITFTALAGLAVGSGPEVSGWRILALTFSVLISSACAGAFNQYYEYESDRLMARTRQRPFVTGELQHTPIWLCILAALLLLSVVAAAMAINAWSALFVLLGAFFYAVVYTVWLKRRTWLNIVVGGLAGSWAVLAGASAADRPMSSTAIALALILFLWTPPHFWSLAIAYRADYAAAGIPMLPVLVGDRCAAHTIFVSTLILVAVSFLPLLLGLGLIYLVGALVGGALFVHRAWLLSRNPERATAMACFHASLTQLTLVLSAAIVDSLWTR